MRFVVDTNILFSFFWKDSITRKIILKIQLFAPEFALEEINKYKEEIKKKAKITEEQFKELRQELALTLDFVVVEEYRVSFGEVITPDTNDVDFIGLALYLELPLWSNDSELKKQRTVVVVSTSDLLNNPEVANLLFPLE